jgi:hypothetical protein
MERGEVAVMIVCPSTGRPVNTGLTIAKAEFQRVLLGSREVRCPHCRQIHVWSKRKRISPVSRLETSVAGTASKKSGGLFDADRRFVDMDC